MANWKNHRLLTANLIILGITGLYFVITRNDESNNIGELTIIFLLLAFPIITLVNGFINWFLNKFLPWNRFRIRRFFVQVILGLIISLLITNALYFVLKSVYTRTPPEPEQIILLNLFGAAIIIPVITILLGIKFLQEWNQSQLETERLQKENARSQMMSLRNHLDPHFLFNNLNILSSLMDYDIALSKDYLAKFAEVYRTILKSELSDLITLEEEMNLVDAYTYLIKVRWQEGIQINTHLDSSQMEKVLPPLAVQMLLENAIKHNTISRTDPITIDISVDDDSFLEVKNTKRIKKYIDKNRKGTGLENIKRRYEYFTDKKVVIKNSEDTFEVLLPLLNIE